tara:strand:- start:1401 stop:2021 length:621 start_codon:yes stop_codon:yes gene_type:complete
MYSNNLNHNNIHKDSISYLKSLERKKYYKLRKSVSENTKGFILKNFIDYIKNNKVFSNPLKYTAIYWPIKDEIDLRIIKNYITSKIALPFCNKSNNIDFLEWDNSPLIKDSKGILAPNNMKILTPDKISTIFVSALTIDPRNIRLGYGGGFYDRLRSSSIWMVPKTIAVLPEICLSKSFLPKEKWDIPINGYITEKTISIQSNSQY